MSPVRTALPPLPSRSRLPLVVLAVAALVVVVGGMLIFETGEPSTAVSAGPASTAAPGQPNTAPRDVSAGPATSTPTSAADGVGPAGTSPAVGAASTPPTSGGGEPAPTAAAPTTTATPDAAPVTLRAASAEEPHLVLVAGDSLAGAPSWSLEELAAQDAYLSIVSDFRISTGVVRSDFFDWLPQVRTLRDSYDPDVFVLAMGANDVQSFPGGPGQPLSDDWLDYYGERVGQMFDDLEGRLVVWIGLPPMGDSRLADAMAPINEAVRARAEQRPWVRYLDLFGAFGDGSGGFVTHGPGPDGQTARLRGDDGVHYTGTGGDLVASMVKAIIDEHSPEPVPLPTTTVVPTTTVAPAA